MSWNEPCGTNFIDNNTYFAAVFSLKCVLVLWFSCCFELNDFLVDGGSLIQWVPLY